MKILITILVLIGIALLAYWLYRFINRTAGHNNFTDFISNLDHDIYIPYVSKICDEKKTGFDTWVGPTGWPWTDKVMWEIALYEDDNYYYARLIFHEYMLWWSWDDPYIVCKIPKCNVNGNLRTDEKLRYEVLWRITDTTLKSYSYSPYINNPIIQKINGHHVAFGDYNCNYNKYFVICDQDHKW